MVMNRGWSPEVFLEPVPKGSARFSYILLWTIEVLAPKCRYHTTLLKFAVPLLGGHEEGFYGACPLKMYLDPQVVACPVEPFPQSMDVRNHYGYVLVAVVI